MCTEPQDNALIPWQRLPNGLPNASKGNRNVPGAFGSADDLSNNLEAANLSGTGLAANPMAHAPPRPRKAALGHHSSAVFVAEGGGHPEVMAASGWAKGGLSRWQWRSHLFPSKG